MTSSGPAVAELNQLADRSFARFRAVLDEHRAKLSFRETGVVRSLRAAIAVVHGLAGVKANELVTFPSQAREQGGAPLQGVVFNLDADAVSVVLLGAGRRLGAGDEVVRTGRVMDVPVGEALLGRMVNALGEPLDGGPAPATEERWPLERPAPPILARAAVHEPLQTGWKVVDALIPIGKGQRELIVGDRQTGKTTIAVDAILNQRGKDVLCIYCAIGQRSAAITDVVETLRRGGAMDYTIVVVAAGHDSPGLQVFSPYAATTMGEYFAERGRDVLIVYDDLSHHAHAYRELSLLLRRPPGREAYPGDIFYLHSRLLERSTHFNEAQGGGSLTALPIIQTQAENISAYIPTNLISITDGQIYLSPELMRKSIYPAVDVGRSVSRVGGRAQLPALREVASPLRLSYSQFQEMELFTRFGTQLDSSTRHQLERGRRIRRVLQQPLHRPLSVARQVGLLHAVAQGLLDEVAEDRISAIEEPLGRALETDEPALCDRIEAGEDFSRDDRERLEAAIRRFLRRQNLEGSAQEQQG
jgi:F-type H+/Na+-transporting ATPase subunit alpha